ncbi:MlaD family protein [Mycolicibacterium austroafricanum]|uniref:MlaD family protein n=1 Tax=Mycolicibacterium austroafricanum TaxID=39687 RepID=UPI001CA30855|nr:MlaD family protein [Mycolicibacterium austroafricanum]QZT58615.1 MlaD family protein [Mycolicibacterium austroafricanum]
MRSVKNIASFGAFAVIIAVTVTYIASFGVHVGAPDDRTNLSMNVPDVKGLVIGSSVLLRGVPVGKVTGVQTTASSATVDFYVDGDHRIPLDSDVRLDNLSALGEAYIGLMPRSDGGPVLTDGQHIGTESIVVPPSISELSTSVVRVLNQLDRGQLERTVAETDAALPDPDLVLPNLTRASQLFRNMTVSMNGRGQEVLANFQTLLQNADWVGPTLADLAPQVRDAGDGVRRTYWGMMNTIAWNNPVNMDLFGDFLGRIQVFLDERGPDVKVLTQALTPQFTGIGGALMNFDTGRMLSNALSGIPEEGAITLRVTIPDR